MESINNFILKFRRKSNKTPTDPNNHVTKLAQQEILLDKNTSSSVWSNGAVSIFSKMKTSDESISSNPNVTLPTIERERNFGLQRTRKNPDMQKKTHINGVHEVRNSIIAGSSAGMLSVSIFHPFDVIRTKMQVSTRLVTAENATTTLLSTSAPKNVITSSSGPIAVFSHTIKNGGMRAFYTGFSFPLLAQACYKSTVFTVNRVAQNFVVDVKTKEQWKTGIFTPYQLKLSDHFVCGSVSGAINALVFVSPVEYVRNQLISQHTHIADGTTSKLKYGVMSGPLELTRATLKTEGIIGLWRGAGVTVVRDSIGCGSFFLFFQLGKTYLPMVTGAEPTSQIHTIGAGMCAGLGYWAITLPLDTLKTLVQTGKTNSAMNTVSLLVNRDGFYGAVSQLYRGWQMAFGRGTPSAAITLTTYSAVYHFLDEQYR
jgi:hypothetical protein